MYKKKDKSLTGNSLVVQWLGKKKYVSCKVFLFQPRLVACGILVPHLGSNPEP